MLWQKILEEGSARPIPRRIGGPADAIICTDGFYPEKDVPGEADSDQKDPRIGGVMFTRWRGRAFAFPAVVTPKIIARWIPRKTQIAQVEFLAPVAAFEAFGSEPAHKKVIALVDSESALLAAIKGYSVKEDISDSATRRWDVIHRNRRVVYFDRILTDANISDGPCRDDWTDGGAAGWATQHIEIHFDDKPRAWEKNKMTWERARFILRDGQHKWPLHAIPPGMRGARDLPRPDPPHVDMIWRRSYETIMILGKRKVRN